MSIIETIVKAHYAATPAQVEQLAHAVVEGRSADGTYLRVLLHAMQGRLGRPRRGKQPPQEPVLDSIHEELYPSVLRGVGPAELDQRERFRRATFARSAASTVRFFIRGGGDVRGVDVATATKTGLRKAVAPQAEVPAGTRAERAFQRASEAVVRTATRLARGDPEGAREHIEALMDQLEALLPAEAEHGATTTIVARRPTHAAPAQLHRGA